MGQSNNDEKLDLPGNGLPNDVPLYLTKQSDLMLPRPRTKASKQAAVRAMFLRMYGYGYGGLLVYG